MEAPITVEKDPVIEAHEQMLAGHQREVGSHTQAIAKHEQVIAQRQAMIDAGINPDAQVEMGDVTNADFALAQSYYHLGMEQYDLVAYGEKDAKTLILAGFVARGAIALTGVPGGAKTLLANNAHRIFLDINPSNVVQIPIDPELSPRQVTGAVMKHTRTTTNSDGKELTTTLSNEIEAIVHPETQVIVADELPRANPYIANALLYVPEERALHTTAGTVDLPGQQLLIATGNPSDSKEGSFKIAVAMASRQTGGVIMGDDIDRAQKGHLFQRHFTDPTQVVPVTSTRALARLQEVSRKVMVPETVEDFAIRAIDIAKDKIEGKYRIREDNRPYIQAGHMTAILGMFDGGVATQEHAQKAIKFMIAGRIGLLVSRNPHTALNDLYQEVMSEAGAN